MTSVMNLRQHNIFWHYKVKIYKYFFPTLWATASSNEQCNNMAAKVVLDLLCAKRSCSWMPQAKCN